MFAIGKKRRLTIIECGNELNTMIDVAKVADLVCLCSLLIFDMYVKAHNDTHIYRQVLLLVDGSFGFEMETFEFLNILQVHGFPKVMGVLTHLDMFKSIKTLRKTKKRLKQRFWTEIYQVSINFLVWNFSLRINRALLQPVLQFCLVLTL